MYSVLAVDLDDTLLDDEKTVSPRTLAALQAWEQSGRRVVIATGRPPRITRLIPDALHHYPWVCYNGVWVEQQRKILLQQTIPVGDAQQIVGRIQQELPGCRLGVEIEDRLYINRQLDRPGAHFVEDVLAHTDRPPAKILTALAEFEGALGLLDELPASTRALVSPKYDLIQVMPAAASKASALSWLLARWGVGWDQVIAFGDDVNDVEMVAEAGLGVAMDNAVEEVKAVANRITGCNNTHGVASVVEELLA